MTVDAHVDNIKKKFRSRTWALRNLKRKGMSEEGLVRVYTTTIRPTVEYASAIWHPMISVKQSLLLERQQTQALRNIFGNNLSARQLRAKAAVPLLEDRRKNACIKLAQKSLQSDRFSDWFPRRDHSRYSQRHGVNYNRFEEEQARTERYRNCPINYMRRIMNCC